MNAVLRVIGTLLRLVGISSPEDEGRTPKPRPADGPPSWRDSSAGKGKNPAP